MVYIQKTAITIPFGLHAFPCMPFSLWNIAQIFWSSTACNEWTSELYTTRVL